MWRLHYFTALRQLQKTPFGYRFVCDGRQGKAFRNPSSGALCLALPLNPPRKMEAREHWRRRVALLMASQPPSREGQALYLDEAGKFWWVQGFSSSLSEQACSQAFCLMLARLWFLETQCVPLASINAPHQAAYQPFDRLVSLIHRGRHV